MGADCEIPGHIGVRVTKEGVDTVTLCADCDFQSGELVASPGVGENYNPVIPPPPLTTNTAKSTIPTSNPTTVDENRRVDYVCSLPSTKMYTER